MKHSRPSYSFLAMAVGHRAITGERPVLAGQWPRKGVIAMFGKPYRGCPICRSNLSELFRRHEQDQDWEVYQCSNCGSEVWIIAFKELLLRGR